MEDFIALVGWRTLKLGGGHNSVRAVKKMWFWELEWICGALIMMVEGALSVGCMSWEERE